MFAAQQNIFVINYEMLSTCAHEEKCMLSILMRDLHNRSNELNLLWWWLLASCDAQIFRLKE